MMNEYKGLINKSIISSYKEAMIIDVMEDKMYKYLIKDNDIVFDSDLSYMEYLNSCNNFIYSDDIDNYVESLSVSRLENEKDIISLSYKRKDSVTNLYVDYMNDVSMYELNGKKIIVVLVSLINSGNKYETENDEVKSRLETKMNNMIDSVSMAILKIHNVINNGGNIQNKEEIINSILSALTNEYPELTKRGFVAVKSNCSLQSYVPAIYPLSKFGVDKVLVCTYQAISGAGKTFERWPEMVDNVIPYIGGEEEKSEQEPLKIWGKVENGEIVNATEPKFTAQCIRVPVSDGHMAAVFVSFKDKKPSKEEILEAWANFSGAPQELELPHAPKHFLNYFTEDNMPQTKLHRDLEGGMAVSIGRLREDSQYDYKFVCLSHNTLRGAAGGAVLLAELLCAQGYMD